MVAECEFVEGEGMEEDTGDKDPAPEAGDTEGAEGDEEDKDDLPPKPNYKPPPVIPKEEFGTGANKKVYFVCNDGNMLLLLLLLLLIQRKPLNRDASEVGILSRLSVSRLSGFHSIIIVIIIIIVVVIVIIIVV